MISRGFVVAASAYRRMAGAGHDYSPEALQAQYRHETYGDPKPDARHNGYTHGKSVLDITLAAMRADHADGLFTKHELMRGSCALVRRFVRSLPVVTAFVHG